MEISFSRVQVSRTHVNFGKHIWARHMHSFQTMSLWRSNTPVQNCIEVGQSHIQMAVVFPFHHPLQSIQLLNCFFRETSTWKLADRYIPSTEVVWSCQPLNEQLSSFECSCRSTQPAFVYNINVKIQSVMYIPSTPSKSSICHNVMFQKRKWYISLIHLLQSNLLPLEMTSMEPEKNGSMQFLFIPYCNLSWWIFMVFSALAQRHNISCDFTADLCQ